MRRWAVGLLFASTLTAARADVVREPFASAATVAEVWQQLAAAPDRVGEAVGRCRQLGRLDQVPAMLRNICLGRSSDYAARAWLALLQAAFTEDRVELAVAAAQQVIERSTRGARAEAWRLLGHLAARHGSAERAAGAFYLGHDNHLAVAYGLRSQRWDIVEAAALRAGLGAGGSLVAVDRDWALIAALAACRRGDLSTLPVTLTSAYSPLWNEAHGASDLVVALVAELEARGALWALPHTIRWGSAHPDDLWVAEVCEALLDGDVEGLLTRLERPVHGREYQGEFLALAIHRAGAAPRAAERWLGAHTRPEQRLALLLQPDPSLRQAVLRNLPLDHPQLFGALVTMAAQGHGELLVHAAGLAGAQSAQGDAARTFLATARGWQPAAREQTAVAFAPYPSRYRPNR